MEEYSHIEEYIIHLGTDPDHLVRKGEINNPASQTQGMQDVIGLMGGMTYFVQIEAKNSVGGNKSLIESYTTTSCCKSFIPWLHCWSHLNSFSEDPPMPTNVTSTTDGLDVTYTMIKLKLILPQDTLCSPIASYIVKDSSTGEKLPSSHSIINNVVIITVWGLESNKEYGLTVSLNNTNGVVGSPSTPVTFTTAESKFSHIYCKCLM